MHRRRSALVVARLVVLLVAAVLVRTQTRAHAPTAGVGVYLPGNNAGLSSYTGGWATQPTIAAFYLQWDSTVPPVMQSAAAEGRMLQVGFSTRSTDGAYVRWSDIARGTYDSHIVAMVKSLDALGVPVMMALDVEPDGQYDKTGHVAPGQTPAQYVAAADHVAGQVITVLIQHSEGFAGENLSDRSSALTRASASGSTSPSTHTQVLTRVHAPRPHQPPGLCPRQRGATAAP